MYFRKKMQLMLCFKSKRFYWKKILLTSALKDVGVPYANNEYGVGSISLMICMILDVSMNTSQYIAEFLKFCFMQLIQTAPDRIEQLWNVNMYSEVHSGKLDI
jgi:hypothetical protein